MSSKLKTFTNGIIKENPVLVLILGTCPTLATSTSMINGLAMGVAATFVLIGSNLVISLLKKVIPDNVRIPAFIVVIAGFVTIVEMMMQAFVQDLYKTLGVYIPLIVVNCIILGRAEMFASKNTPIDSILDGAGMGVGFTLALGAMGFIRELLANWSIAGIRILPEDFTAIGVMDKAPGGFIVFGLLIALINYITSGRAIKKKEFGCSGCSGCASKDGCGNSANDVEVSKA